MIKQHEKDIKRLIQAVHTAIHRPFRDPIRKDSIGTVLIYLNVHRIQITVEFANNKKV